MWQSHTLPLLVACLAAAARGSPLSLRKECSMVDLTHPLNDHMVVYPIKDYVQNPYAAEDLAKGMVDPGAGYDPFFVFYERISTVTHSGTHMDSPQHVTRNRRIAAAGDTIDKIALHKLVGEACVVDVPEHGRKDPDYLITVEDMHQWESAHGGVHADCVVIVRTGRYEHWPDAAKYLGSATPSAKNDKGWPDTLHWPALAPATAQWLVDKRGMLGVASDTMSFDGGQLVDFANSVHSVVLGSNRWGVENLANLGALPNRGATIVAVPLRLEGASGSPIRAFAYGHMGEADPCRWAALNAARGRTGQRWAGAIAFAAAVALVMRA